MNVKTLLCGCALVVATVGLIQANEDDGDQLRASNFSAMPVPVSPQPGEGSTLDQMGQPEHSQAELTPRASDDGRDTPGSPHNNDGINADDDAPEQAPWQTKALAGMREIHAWLDEKNNADPDAAWVVDARHHISRIEKLHANKAYGEIEGVRITLYELLESIDRTSQLFVILNDIMEGHTPDALAAVTSASAPAASEQDDDEDNKKSDRSSANGQAEGDEAGLPNPSAQDPVDDADAQQEDEKSHISSVHDEEEQEEADEEGEKKLEDVHEATAPAEEELQNDGEGQ